MFSDKDKQCYGPKDDGSGEPRYYDPLAINRALISEAGDIEALWEQVGSDSDQLSVLATGKLIDLARKVFELQPFQPKTGGGVTDQMAWDMLNDFLDWVEKKNQAVVT